MRRTKITKFLVAVAATLFVSSSVWAQDTLHLTLDDALKVAMGENISVKVADKEVKRTEYARKGTYASLFPQVDFSGAYQRAIKKQKMHMNMGGQEMDIEVGVSNTWSTGFSAAMPLVNVQLWKAIQITGMDVELAVEKAKGSRQDLIDQVQQSFYGVLLAKELYSVYKENYDNAKDNYNDVKAKYDAGVQPIVRKKAYRPDIDCECVDNVANEVTEFKTSFHWGNPITLVQKSASEDKTVLEKIYKGIHNIKQN
mgnify:CR=1 FL=1